MSLTYSNVSLGASFYFFANQKKRILSILPFFFLNSHKFAQTWAIERLESLPQLASMVEDSQY